MLYIWDTPGGLFTYIRYPLFVKKYRELMALIGIIFFVCYSDILCRGFTEDTLDDSFFARIFLNPLTSISIALLLPYCKEYRINSKLASCCIVYISLYSYSLYLCNLLVSQIIVKYLQVNSLLQFLLFFLMSFVVSYFTYTYFEMPITKLREKFTRR